MAYSIMINSVDRTGDVLTGSISVQDQINDKSNTCSFDLIDLSGNGIPATDQQLTITLADTTILFGGYIVSTDLTDRKSAGVVVVRVSCVDYVRKFDSNLVHKTYENMTDAAIIADVVATYCLGFGITTTNVISDATIDQISFNYIQPSQVMRRLCDLTGNNWYIDYSRDIHYFPTTTATTPFDISSNPISIVQESMLATPSGTLQSVATYDSVNKWVDLTQTTDSTYGALQYSSSLPFSFTTEAEVQAVRGGGGDAIYMYWGASTTPSIWTTATGGYTVVLYEWLNTVLLTYNGTTIASIAAPSDLDDSSWRTLTVVVSKGTSNTNIKIYLNRDTGSPTALIDYNDTNRTLGGALYGIAARNGGVSNNHRVRRLTFTTTYTDYSDLKISKDATQIKNRIYVRGGTKLSDPTTYSVKGDGVARQFPLPDKPHDVSITVNGVGKTLGIKNVHLTGYDWYLNFQEKYLEQDAGGAVLTTTDTIVMTYKYDIPILIAQDNTASIEASGVKEFAIFDKSITTNQAARDRATAELTDYANSIIEGSFTTHTDGFSSGQYININLTTYGVNANYIVQNVTARSLGGGVYVYSVSIASAKTMGIVRFLVELLEANKNLIELDNNEVIDELFLITDSILSDSITDALTIDSAGGYSTWCTASESTPTTRFRWELAQWG